MIGLGGKLPVRYRLGRVYRISKGGFGVVHVRMFSSHPHFTDSRTLFGLDFPTFGLDG